jgi:hypothetical protein
MVGAETIYGPVSVPAAMVAPASRLISRRPSRYGWAETGPGPAHAGVERLVNEMRNGVTFDDHFR